MEGISSNILSSLTKGSGINIEQLARDLADVEKSREKSGYLDRKSRKRRSYPPSPSLNLMFKNL